MANAVCRAVVMATGYVEPERAGVPVRDVRGNLTQLRIAVTSSSANEFRVSRNSGGEIASELGVNGPMSRYPSGGARTSSRYELPCSDQYLRRE